MALRYGFYNSIDHDRVYDADEFSAFLDGIVYDGVYQAVGECFFVEPFSGMKITVGTGRAWFNRTWTWNETKIQLEVPPSHTALPRKDAVIIEVNKRDRRNYIKILQGTPASSPQKPTLRNEYPIYQHALAYITVSSNVTVIQKANIENVVGSAQTPFCSALALDGIPSGGRIGQVLAKASDESGAVGWYDIDNLPYDKWYLADGINESNVLGAYRFIRNSSSSVALIPINTNTNYRLSITNPGAVPFDSSVGFKFTQYNGGLTNNSIVNSAPATIIMRYSDLSDPQHHGSILYGSYDQDSLGDYHEIYLRTMYGYDNGSAGSGWKSSRTIGVNLGNVNWDTTNEGNNAYKNVLVTESGAVTGVVGVSFSLHNSAQIYLNGTSLAGSRPGDAEMHSFGNYGILIGSHKPSVVQHKEEADPSPSTFYVQYAAFYNTILTPQQHLKIANQITSDMRS